MRGHQIIGPRRVALMAIVGDDVAFDSAIDLQIFDLTSYWRDMFPPEMVERSLRPGEQPSWFTIKPMTNTQLSAAPDAGVARAVWLVRCGLIRIENYTLMDDRGERPAPQPKRAEQGRFGEIASEEWVLEESGLSMRDVVCLGSMIEHISKATHPFARRSAVRFGDGAASETKTATGNASPPPPTAPPAGEPSASV